ncbi:MAG: hypothetical protein ACREMZ_15710 [Gemmatimonadales bacterium]
MPRQAFDRHDPEVTLHSSHPRGELGPLFDAPVPFQRRSDTSQAAATAMEPEIARLRRLVMKAYREAGEIGLSADECAARLGISILAIRPRVTEAFMAGELAKTGRRVRNASGQSARVLRIRNETASSETRNSGAKRSPAGG